MNNTEQESQPIKNEQRCVAGCSHYTGGEVKHHKNCTFYEWSISEYIDKILHASKCERMDRARNILNKQDGVSNWGMLDTSDLLPHDIKK